MNIQVSEIFPTKEINTEELITDTSELASLGFPTEKDFIFGEAMKLPTRNIWKIIGYKETLDEGKVYYVKDSLGKEEEFGTIEEIKLFFKQKLFTFVN